MFYVASPAPFNNSYNRITEISTFESKTAQIYKTIKKSEF